MRPNLSVPSVRPWRKARIKALLARRERPPSPTKGPVCETWCEKDGAEVVEGSGQGCSRRGQPAQAGALPRYKSPSTQLGPVKGCAHPAESAALGGQPAPCGGVGRAIWGVPVCVHMCARAFLCKRACVSLCVCLSLFLHVHVCGVSTEACVGKMLAHPVCLSWSVPACTRVYLFVLCVPLCGCGCWDECLLARVYPAACFCL